MDYKQSIEIGARVNSTQAKAELQSIDREIEKLKAKAAKGIDLVSSKETRDVSGNIQSIVDTYKTATGKIETYALRINKAGEAAFSVTSKDDNWLEKQTAAFEKALLKQEQLAKRLESNKITAKTSMFAEIPESTFEAYTSGLTRAGEALSIFGQMSDYAFKQYTSGAMSAEQAMQNLNASSLLSQRDWQALWNTFHGIGQSCGVTAKEVSVFGQLSDDAFEKYSTGAISADEANQSLRASSGQVADSQKEVAKAAEEAGNKADKSGKAFTLLHTIFLRLAHTAISAVTRSFREALTEMKNVDSELVVVRKVSDATAEELSALKDRAYEVGAAYGVAASDYLSAAAEMTRAGYRDQAGDLAELATKLQLVGDVSQDVANQFLIATDKSYKMNGNYQKLSETIDKLNEIDNNFATSFEKVADGIGLLAPVAAQANVSFDEMAAAIGTVTAVTQRSGTESARALRSLYLNIIKDTNTEIEDGVTWTVEEINNLSDALKKYAPDVVRAAEATGELINPMEAVGALAQSYKEGLLTNQGLFDIVSGLGGKLRTSQLLALIQNWDMYNEMLAKTAEAAGSADKEVSNALDSWEVKINQLKNTFTQFTQSLLDSEDIKGFIDSLNFLLKSIDNPDEYGDKFANAFENAVNKLVERLPRIQKAISQVALSIAKTLTKTIRDEVLNALKSLADGSSEATSELAKELPDIITNIFRIVGEVATQSMLDSDLAYNLTVSLLEGIIQAIPRLPVGLLQGIFTAISQASENGLQGWAMDKLANQNGLLGKAGRFLFNKISGYDVYDIDGGYNKVSNVLEEASDGVEEVRNDLEEPVDDAVGEQAEETAKSVKGLTDELVRATEALDKYKNALESGEKGDSLKSYSEAYKKAVEMYEKGLTGSNQYMSAIDLLFGDVDDYEAAGELLGNAFVKAMFEGGGEDYGANAANWIRENIDTLKGVALQEAEDGTFGLDFFDVDAFAESMGLSADAVWVLIDALDAYNSRTVYTREQLFEFIGQVDNGLAKTVNLSEVINNLASEGKTKKQIKEIVEAIQDLANTDGTITLEEPQNLDQTIDDIIELNNEADKDKDMEVVLTSNSEEFFDGIKKEIEQINGTTIYIGLKAIDKPSLKEQPFVGGGGGGGKTFTNILTQSQAEGTRYNRGGLSLVNEEGAELIYANGKAWIAGGGEPTIENLPVGAGVFNAKETREILTRSGIPSFLMGRTNREEPTLEGTGNYTVHNGATVGGLPKTDNGSGSQSGTSGKTPTETKLEDLLESLNTYIDDLLKRAQDALKAQTEAIDEQIDALKRQHDAEENANDLEELRLKILEAEKNLLDAENERTVRYFNQATGQWEWMADQKAVADARKKLEDAQKAYDDKIADLEYEAQIQALQDQKDALNDAYSSLSDNWDNIKEQIEDIVNGTEAVNITELLSKLGLTSASGSVQDVQSLLSAISAFESDVNAGKYNVNSVSLDTYTTDQILSMSHNGAVTNALSQLLGISTADLSSNGQSVFSSSTATTVAGDTIYYINGIKLGSDEASKPLSEILSVLPIYANH